MRIALVIVPSPLCWYTAAMLRRTAICAAATAFYACATPATVVHPGSLTEPSPDSQSTTPTLADATHAETFTFESVGDAFVTENGVTITLRRAAIVVDQRRSIVDIGLSYSAPKQPDVVTSGMGNFFVHGRPVHVDVNQPAERPHRIIYRPAKERLTVTVELAKSQPVPTTQLRSEVDRAAALAHDDGLAFDAYSWRSEPAISGRVVVAYRTTTTEAGISVINLVTGEVDLTRFKIGAMPVDGRARNAPEPFHSMQLSSADGVPVAVALHEASFRQCFRDSLVDLSVEVSRDGDDVSIREREGRPLALPLRRCLRETTQRIRSEAPVSFRLDSQIDFDTWTEKSAIAGIRDVERESLSVNGPMRTEDVSRTLDTHHDAVRHCHLRATWNGARLDGELTITFKLDHQGALQRAVVAQHSAPELAALVPCLQNVVQRAGWKPVDRFSTTVDVTYALRHR